MNSIALAQKYAPLLDEVFKKASVTTDLEAQQVQFDGVNTVKIMKITVPSLGAYDRNSGFTNGDVTVDWEDWKLTQDRGRAFSVDAVDNEETLDMTFGAASREFIRTKVAPQIDAYRFAKLASTDGISKATAAALATGDAVLKALTAGMTKMDEDEVPEEGRILYITPTLKRLVDELDSYKSKKVWEQFAKIVTVPKNRFYTKSQYNSTSQEIEKASGAQDINFMIVVPSAQQSTAKHTKLRIFLADGDEGTGANKNQKKDAHEFQYRIVHDVNVFENKRAGIYLHAAPAASN
ncbi:MAG: hypothetical protein IJW47_01255 [Clostridia bacterium]|nr:hypothetical protein [Clostridia bacterium]